MRLEEKAFLGKPSSERLGAGDMWLKKNRRGKPQVWSMFPLTDRATHLGTFLFFEPQLYVQNMNAT